MWWIKGSLIHVSRFFLLLLNCSGNILQMCNEIFQVAKTTTIIVKDIMKHLKPLVIERIIANNLRIFVNEF
jgi:hypothetical protein